jgi:hypothetical protein
MGKIWTWFKYAVLALTEAAIVFIGIGIVAHPNGLSLLGVIAAEVVMVLLAAVLAYNVISLDIERRRGR